MEQIQRRADPGDRQRRRGWAEGVRFLSDARDHGADVLQYRGRIGRTLIICVVGSWGRSLALAFWNYMSSQRRAPLISTENGYGLRTTRMSVGAAGGGIPGPHVRAI